MHRRLSINALCSRHWSFEQDLALWRLLGVSHAGLLISKIADDPEGKLAQLQAAGIQASTVVCGSFSLGSSDAWPRERELLHRVINSVAKHNKTCTVYFPPGRTTGDRWEEVLDQFLDAVAPSVEFSRQAGMKLAFEPSIRTDASFVTVLRDAVYVAEKTGLGLVVDIGNCWMERDLRMTLQRAKPFMALVQICDVKFGRDGRDVSGGRVHIGEGDLPVERFIKDVLETGYAGLFDLEVLGPAIEAEGYDNALPRGAVAASNLLDHLGL